VSVFASPAPAPILELLRDGWRITGPDHDTWGTGYAYHADCPLGRLHLYARRNSAHTHFHYTLNNLDPIHPSTRLWLLAMSDSPPDAVTAAARTALRCDTDAEHPLPEPRRTANLLLKAGWTSSPRLAPHGLAATVLTSPRNLVTASLLPAGFYRGERTRWVIDLEPAPRHGPAEADPATPAEVLTAYLLAAYDALSEQPGDRA
jgi:hypothetical protein